MGMDPTDDFFRDIYTAELEHKDKLDSADSLLVAVLLALSGVGIYYLKVLPSCGYGIAGCVFLFLSAVFLITFGFATGFVIASFWPRDKGYISNPEDWGRYVAGLEDYYGHYHDEQEVKKRVADELAKTLRQQYIKASEVNRNLNIKKMGYQTWTRRSITAAVVVLALNAYPTYLVQCAKSDIQKIEIVTSKEREECNGKRHETTDTPTAADSATATSPAKAGTPEDRTDTGRGNPRKAQPVTGKE